MIQDWQTFSEIFSAGLACGFFAGLSALLVRYIRLTYCRWFRMSANL